MTPPRVSTIQLRAATLGEVPGSGAVFVQSKSGRPFAHGMFYAETGRREELTALIRKRPDSIVYSGPVWIEGAYRKATFGARILKQGTTGDPMITFESEGTVVLSD